MNKSESIAKIAAALNKAQKNIGSAIKGAKNPFFKSTYATLGDVMEACKEPLNDQGISILQPVISDETGDYVETMLLHESGEFLSSRMKVITGKNMQELGSAISYSKRYSLQSMVFIPSEDDDAEGSMGRSTKSVPSESKAQWTSAAAVPTTVTNVKEKPAAANVASLDANGLVPANQLPPAGAAKTEEKKRPTFQRSVKPANNGGF